VLLQSLLTRAREGRCTRGDWRLPARREATCDTRTPGFQVRTVAPGL